MASSIAVKEKETHEVINISLQKALKNLCQNVQIIILSTTLFPGNIYKLTGLFNIIHSMIRVMLRLASYLTRKEDTHNCGF